MAKLTEKAILRTFDEMISEMPFDKITVSALVARCEISSNTFYYHYHDIYALLDEWLDIKLGRKATQVFLTNEWKDVLKELLHRFQDNRNTVNHVFISISRDRLERYVFDVLLEDIDAMFRMRLEGEQICETSIQTMSSVFCYTIFGFLLKYMYNGMKDDIDAVFDPILDFLDSSISSYLRLEPNQEEKD